jgi:hypothetical protein
MAAEIDERLQKVVAPVVHGQIRSFRTSHGDVVTKGLAGSLAKRIINDLCGGETLRRLRAATLVAAGESFHHPRLVNYRRGHLPCGGRGSDEERAGYDLTGPLLVREPLWREFVPVLCRVNGWVVVIPPGSRSGMPRSYRLDKLVIADDATPADGTGVRWRGVTSAYARAWRLSGT